MLMSEALKIKQDALDADDTPSIKTDPKNPRGNGSHLTLVKNEDITDELNPSNPKIH